MSFDLWVTCPNCREWRCRARITEDGSGENLGYTRILPISCFVDLRCLNCGYHYRDVYDGFVLENGEEIFIENLIKRLRRIEVMKRDKTDKEGYLGLNGKREKGGDSF
jgi:hypothetical protein